MKARAPAASVRGNSPAIVPRRTRGGLGAVHLFEHQRELVAVLQAAGRSAPVELKALPLEEAGAVHPVDVNLRSLHDRPGLEGLLLLVFRDAPLRAGG